VLLTDVMLANENLRSKHIRTLEVLRSVTKENAELKTRCKELSIEGGVLKDRLAEAERNAAEEETKRVRAEEMDSLRARVEKLTARERSLEHDFLKMKMHASEVEHDRQNLGKELRRLKEALRDAARAETSRGAKEEEETSRIRSKLTDAIAKNKSYVKMESEMRRAIDIAKRESKESREKLRLSRDEAEKLKGTVERLKSSIRQMRTKIESASKASNASGELKRENVTLRERCARLEHEVSEEKVRASASSAKIVALEEKVRLLTLALKELRDATSAARGSNFAKFVSLKNENRALSSELATMRKKRASLKNSRLSGERRGNPAEGNPSRRWAPKGRRP